MNKTVTINISGIIFHIEEDAYAALSKYIATIRGYFSKADGGSEIMSDIEARIAEMLQAKTSPIKQVVLMSDVDAVMENMGKPEEFAGDSQENFSNQNDNNSNNNYSTTNNETVTKRVFRDADNKVLGGVCGGIGNYFGVDPVWMRIAIACLFFFAGTGFLLYLILWIAIPEAKTTAEKLAMKGEKADINNISKAVKEEAEQLKKRAEKYGNDFKNMATSTAPKNAAEKGVDFLTDVITNVGRVLLKIIGVFLVIIGVCLFLGLFGSVFGLSFFTNNIDGKDWIDLFLLDGSDLYVGLIGLVFFVGIPVIMLIYGGINLLFKTHYTNRWVNLSAGVLWLFGFILLLYVGLRTAKEFKRDAKVRENIIVTQSDTLILKMNNFNVNMSEMVDNYATDDEGNFKIRNRKSDYMIGKNGNERYLLGHAQLNIIKSQTNQIEIVVVKEAKGFDKKIASNRAQNIKYTVSQTDSLLLFDNLFKVNNADKFRFQDVKVIVKLPLNKVVYLDKSLEDFMYDIENVTNTFDGDMVNRRWMMTEKGLKCLDCDGLTSLNDNAKDEDADEEKEVNINVNGVKINADNASVKIDSTGINIKSSDGNVIINNKGVHVNSKTK